MRSNWKQRLEQREERRVGHQLDQYINMGIKLMSVAMNEELGIGRKKLERCNKRILEYIEHDFIDGAAQFTDAYRVNVEIGCAKLDRVYEQIMTRGDKAREMREKRRLKRAETRL